MSIDNCDSITTFNLHNFSLKTFENLGVKPSLIPLFTFYHKEHIPKFDKKKFKENFLNMYGIPKNSIILFSHVAHYWKKLLIQIIWEVLGKETIL